MSKYLIDSLNQKFDIKSLKVFFNIADGGNAEIILNSLDRAVPQLKNLFDREPSIEVFLYPDAAAFEKGTQKPLGQNETLRLVPGENVLLLCSARLPQPLDEEVIRGLTYMVFDGEVKEREIGMMQYRTPSWLRDGYGLQISSRLRSDGKAYLLAGWTALQEAEKTDKLIKPNMMVKYVGLIPDPARRTLALHQAFFMVKFLHTVYPDRFIKKYGTLMSALEDMEAESGFQQITGYDYEKFFVLFKDWVKSTNIWVAVTD